MLRITHRKGSHEPSWCLQGEPHVRTLIVACIITRRIIHSQVAYHVPDEWHTLHIGLFWLQAGQTNTVYGVQQSNGQLFFMMLYVAVRVSHL